MRYVWKSPTNDALQYVTGTAGDPGVPAGYLLTSGSDGAADRSLQTYVAGLNSGGYPAYVGEPTQNVNPKGWVNGIFGV
jgi:hypothetical protein